ncbi:hypothetical protein SPBR_09185 [Sporothrix brasiliensis 5110]|uniref:Uncharacterized protein n=1 Tax=Sporothrix brasiliensis 5110 TaxID=1398154 RepID=A0A0C2F399_9PEZI|nr:uncharacterized protein SPBR_09185 [Sporothrix brasiliensis 5110]KIH93359.1 hypothetical protein SPBR_09185 [Sporothrix brasiliensis 5110]
MASYASDDPDAGPLLAPASTTRARHRVRIQGRLVHIRSVSSCVATALAGPATYVRRPTEVVQFYALSRTGTGQDRGRRRWQWVSSLFGVRGQKDIVKDGQGHHDEDRAVDADAVQGEGRP